MTSHVAEKPETTIYIVNRTTTHWWWLFRLAAWIARADKQS